MKLPKIDLCPECKKKYEKYLEGTIIVSDALGASLAESSRTMEEMTKEIKRENDDAGAGEDWKQ